MVVVKTLDELKEYISKGFKPYYHEGVGRWYLRKGQERHLIAKELEPYVKELAEKISVEDEMRKVEKDLRLAEALKLRAEGKTVSEVLRETGISKSTFYRSDVEDVYEKLRRAEENLSRLLQQLQQRAQHTYSTPQTKPSTPQSTQVPVIGESVYVGLKPRARESRDFEEEYVVRIPIERDFSREILCGGAKLFESTLPLPRFSLILCGVESLKCPKCQAELRVEKRTPYMAVRVQCKN